MIDQRVSTTMMDLFKLQKSRLLVEHISNMLKVLFLIQDSQQNLKMVYMQDNLLQILILTQILRLQQRFMLFMISKILGIQMDGM